MNRSEIQQRLKASGGRGDNEILRDAFSSLEPSRGTGWISFTDTQYTTTTPLVCPGGQRTVIDFTYTGPDVGGIYAGDMDSSVLDGSTFRPIAPGDSYFFSLGVSLRTTEDMQAGLRGVLSALLTGDLVAAAADNQNDVTFGLDFGFFDITDTRTAPRQVGKVREYNFNDLFQVRDSNIPPFPNGATFFVEPEKNTEVFDIDLRLERIFTPEN